MVGPLAACEFSGSRLRREWDNASNFIAVGVATPGVYEFQLTVSGPDGQTASSVVNVLAPLPQVSFAIPAFASKTPYVGGPVYLAAAGQDQAFPESSLTYTWYPISIPRGASAPKFSSNGSNRSKLVSVSFTTPGTYSFRVAALNPFSQVASSDVTVVVGPRRSVTVKSTGKKSSGSKA